MLSILILCFPPSYQTELVQSHADDNRERDHRRRVHAEQECGHFVGLFRLVGYLEHRDLVLGRWHAGLEQTDEP